MKKFSPEFEMLRRDVPCWYELSWDRENMEIIFRIHKDVLCKNHEVASNSPMVRTIAHTITNPYFERSLYKNFGFGGFWKDIINKGFTGNFLEIIFKIPRYTSTSCLYCNEGDECEFHESENEFSFRRAYNISASWTILCLFLRFSATKTSCSKTQLMTITPIVEQSMHGGSLNCTLSKKAVDWLSEVQQDADEIVEVTEAMRKTHTRIFGPCEYEDVFYTRVQPGGGLIMQCPGDACDLAPGDYAREGWGYQLWPHNVDTPFQQITFVAGLAALHDKIRNE